MMLNDANTTMVLSTLLVSCRSYRYSYSDLIISTGLSSFLSHNSTNVNFLQVFNGRREIPLINHESIRLWCFALPLSKIYLHHFLNFITHAYLLTSCSLFVFVFVHVSLSSSFGIIPAFTHFGLPFRSQLASFCLRSTPPLPLSRLYLSTCTIFAQFITHLS